MRRTRYLWRALALGALLVGLVVVRTAGVRAATDTVSTCDESTLRSVINGAMPGDTVNFACSGTITLTAGGGGRIVLSKNLTIDGGGQAVTISGGNSVQVLAVNAGVTVILNALTIANGATTATANGGGIENSGTLTVTNSTFSGNKIISGNGGGIFNAITGTLTVAGSTFSGDSASVDGGGIFNNAGSATVANSTFSGNHAGTFGGGIFNNTSGTLTVANSTLSGNSAAIGGAISTNANGSLANTILAGSGGGDCFTANTITDKGGNLADDNTCAFTQIGSTNNATSLNLGPLADNVGPTQTIALLPGSTAIDVTSCLQPADQRNFPRPDSGESKCDSGAYEFQDVPFLTSTPTSTNRPAPPTSTFTNTPTHTPTDTPTFTPVPPTSTFTSTPTSTPTSTFTKTPVPPTGTATNTPTNTPTHMPTNTTTNTPVPPTGTFTNTPVPPTSTSTNTPVPSTSTFTKTPVPATSTATNTPVSHDTTPPSCALTGVGTNSGGKKYIQVTVQDGGSGLQAVAVSQVTNATTLVPAFAVGTTSAVVVTVTKVNQKKWAHVGLMVTDVAGNVSRCDSLLIVVSRDDDELPWISITDIARREHLLHIYNGNQGLRHLIIRVNGIRIRVRHLEPNERRTMDISRALRPGDHNTVVVIARGTQWGEATLVFAGS